MVNNASLGADLSLYVTLDRFFERLRLSWSVETTSVDQNPHVFTGPLFGAHSRCEYLARTAVRRFNDQRFWLDISRHLPLHEVLRGVLGVFEDRLLHGACRLLRDCGEVCRECLEYASREPMRDSTSCTITHKCTHARHGTAHTIQGVRSSHGIGRTRFQPTLPGHVSQRRFSVAWKIRSRLNRIRKIMTRESQSKRQKKTYNSRYSLVVTDPTTNQPLSSLTRGERTGSRVFY